MTYRPHPLILKALAAVFLLILVCGCARETPNFPTTYEEEQADYQYLSLLSNTRAINTVGMAKENVDHNRTVNRVLTSRERSNNDLRLQMVGRRVLAAAYPICPKEYRSRSLMVGIVPRSQTQPIVLWAINEFGMDDRETLKIGDVILGMGNEDIPPGLSGTRRAQEILADYANRMEPLKFRVDRDGEILRITQQPMKFCNYQIRLVRSSQFNAYADDKTISVNTGVMPLLSTDDELEALIGHETAHNVMRHIPKDRWLYILNGLARIFTDWGVYPEDDIATTLANSGFSRQHEAEADYVGAYLTAMAGYDPEGALNLVKMMAARNPDYISGSDQWDDTSEIWQSHPEYANRYGQMRRAVEQIKEKQNQGLKPLPDFLY